MKQILKDTIIAWVVLSASVCVVVGVPFLFLHYVGIGGWQTIVSILWFLFWMSFAIAIGTREETESEDKDADGN